MLEKSVLVRRTGLARMPLVVCLPHYNKIPDITNLDKVHLGLTALGVSSVALGQRVHHGDRAVGWGTDKTAYLIAKDEKADQGAVWFCTC